MLKINELRISSAGSSDDTSNFIELIGPPNQDLTGHSLVVISGEFAPGSIDFAFDLTGHSTDSDGVFLLSNPGEYANDAGDRTESFDFFGSPVTVMLVDGFTGAQGDDLDSDDDGTPETMPWAAIVDSLSLVDGDGTPDVNYAATVVGPDGNFAPAAVARVPDETGAFVQNAFDDRSADTPGALNAPAGVSDFTLELLHFTDQEAATGAITDAPNLSAVLNALRAQDLGNDGLADNTLTLSSGDAFLPGVFFDSSEAVFGSAGIADIQIQNELVVQAMALGNHEFDKGTEVLADLISGDAPGDIFGTDFAGAAFPYLSTNLDFSTDAEMAPLVVPNGQAPQPNAVSGSTVIDSNGALIGVVGATTPTLDRISSPDDVTVTPIWADTNPTSDEIDALAAEIQTEVDALLADTLGLNKVVLLAHMQQLTIEQELAARLENVDIIVAGGSNTRLFDDNDRPRDGDSDQGQYPQFVTNAGGTQTAVVNTDGSYKYVGRLVIDFDAAGNILPGSYDQAVSGAYATDAQGVSDLGAAGLIDPEIQAIADAIEAQIIAAESNVFGFSDVFLNGNRGSVTDSQGLDGVRTQETNLGNLTADANLAAAQAVDPAVVVSIKNGGGIRASIGETVVPAGGVEAVRGPNAELIDGDGNVIKPEGGISENDIKTVLAFNNDLSLLTLTRTQLIEVLEHGIAALPDVNGRFPQVSGVEFSFDLDQPAGSRIVDAAIVDDTGTVLAELMSGGAVVGDPAESFRIVTLGFLAGGGDGYPFPQDAAADRLDLTDLDRDGNDDGQFTGNAVFAADGTEQDVLAEYLSDNSGTPADAFDAADGIAVTDMRIQNLDAVDPDAEPNFMAPKADPDDLRVATYNASLNRSAEGDLISDLSTPDDVQARNVAEVIQRTDPDVILINEFDFDENGTAANLFRTNYLEVGQNGQDPVEYPYVYVAPSNTGVATGLDLDNDGTVGGPGDAQGFGFFEGQFGFVIYSKHPIDEDNIRTFRDFLWKDMPDARLPADPDDTDGNGDLTTFYTDAELDVLRLSSKNHVDVPIIVDGETVHVLAAHPTPPVFDGPEDRNGLRNADEIRFWADYVEPANSGYIYDDDGQTGGLPAGERFVILGDYNADPFDGDSVGDAALQLLDNPRIAGSATDPAITPDSTGGPEAADAQAGANDTHLGDPAFDTADFGFAGAGNPDGTPGNLRVDYVLPSRAGFTITDGQVFWPDAETFPEQAALAGFPTSDHRLVSMDLDLTEAPQGTGEIRLERLSAFDPGSGEGGSEVVVFDPDSARMFTTNGEEDRIDVTDLADPANPVLLFSIDLSGSVPDYDGVQSVAVSNGLGAAAVSRASEDSNGDEDILEGTVVTFDTATGTIQDSFTVGFLPDMVTFTPDGSKILVANEGEPDDLGDDPGGVSIIDVASGTVTHANFRAFDPLKQQLIDEGVRIFPDGNGDPLDPSLDFEPEYITVSADGTKAYVTLQEANAVAVLDITFGVFVDIQPLGTIDHSLPGNELDASDKDDVIAIQNWPLNGMHMPDAIASYEVGGTTYYVTANEGDARDADERGDDVDLDPTAFPNADLLQENELLGRIEVSTIDGDTDGDGDLDALFSYGTRSFSIFDENGNRVFDSGSDFERIIAEQRVPNAFNNQDFPNDDPDVVDENRSDNKGPEPEAVTVGRIGDEVYAFVGLERDNGIMVYNVTDPADARFVQYINSAEDGDISPETLAFVPAADSPNGQPLLLAANEVSGTTAIYTVDVAPIPNALPNGAASGDVTEDSAVLIARSLNPGDVTFALFDESGAEVQSLTARVTDTSVPVKVKAEGLTPGTDYTYTVTDATGAMLDGTFSTAHAEGFNGLKFGITGDWRGELAPYAAVSKVPDAALDFMLLGGDTIYADYPSPAVPEHARSLEEFRAKYAEVYGETLGENFFGDLFRSTPVYVTMDDHEVTNDFAGGGRIGTTGEAEFRDFFPGDDPDAFVNDATLFENGLQAFHDFHPIEERFYGVTGDPLTSGERQLYRSQEFGQDAAVFVLDQRSFRDEQIDSVDLTDPADYARFIAESNDPARTLLGAQQLADLKADLLEAEANGVAWKFVYAPEPFQNLGLGNGDSWEGYEAERRDLLKFIEDNQIDNVVFVAADIHATFVNNITYSDVPGGPQIGTSTFEITTGSVAFDPAFGPAVVQEAAAIGLLTPQEVAFYDSLPIAPDDALPGGLPNDKDDIVREAFNDLRLTPLGLDPLGLDDNLAQADGMIDATLVQGGWVSAHTFGWTEFEIDDATQQLTVTTYGIPGYSENDLASDPEAVIGMEPMIVSQFTVEAQPNLVKIFDVQGAGHRSPLEGQDVAVEGVVTAIDPGEGFWVQDPDGDGDAATSDGIFVDYGSTGDVAKGDMVRAQGTVTERQFGTDLPVTTLSGGASVTVMSGGNPLPAAQVIGAGGLLPPTGQIDDDGLNDFQPAQDGIDFFEALEGMRVSLVDGAQVIGSNRFGETFVSVNSGPDGRTDAGGLRLQGENGQITDANPERILIDDDIYADSGRGADADSVPAATTGDTVLDVTGVFDYSFGEFKLLAEEAPVVTPGGTTPEVSTLPAPTGSGELTVGTYNLLNLDPGDPQSKFDKLAQDIVTGMGAPAIIGLQEIQDNTGPTDDGTVAADVTYQMLIDAISAAGGPGYAFADSTPQDKTDGGQPGANIRVGFLYDPARVSLTDSQRIEGALDPEGAFDADPVPGDGVNEGFEGTRKPLVGTFDVSGEEVTVVVTHFKSKSGDDPLSGEVQPPVEVTSAQRSAQAQVVNSFVSGLLDSDPNAKIVVLGDMNDFEFSQPLMDLAGDDLTNLAGLLAPGDAYSFNFNGNSQLLDHILVSDALLATAQVDVVHLNSDFPSDSVASDHDPLVAAFDLDDPNALVFGSENPDQLIGSAGDNRFTPGPGGDTLVLQGGADSVQGSAGDFDGDIILGFGSDDVFAFEGQRLSGSDIGFDATTGTLTMAGEEVNLFGSETDGGAFMVTRDADGDSAIRFVMNRIALEEGKAVEAGDVNGIDPEAFLTGGNGQSYGVELDVSGAGNANALGYFLRDAATGAIEAVEILFANAKTAGAGATATIEDVAADQELGFFLVADGARAVNRLTGEAGLAERNGQLFVTDDGAVLEDTLIFNSLDASLNADGLEHVLSGATADGQGLRVGFEDLLGGGDMDFQDVTFTVSVLDDTLL